MIHPKFAAVLLTLAILTANVHCQAADKALRIGYVYAMANAPALIAEKQGFFQQEGLNVQVKALGDGPIIQQALAAGELDIAYVGTPPVFQWFSRGLESRIIAKVNYGQAAVIVNAQSQIHELAELKGQKLAGVKKGSGMDVLLRGYVLKENAKLDPELEVSIIDIPPGNMNAALERKLVDAAFSWEPFVSQALLRGNSRLLLDVNQALPNYPWYVITAMPDILKQRPDDVLKLLRAHRKAIAFLNEHPDAANRIIAEAFNLEAISAADGTHVSPEQIVAEARKRLGWSAELPVSDLQFIQRLMTYSRELGYMTSTPSLEQLVDTSYLEKTAR